MMCILLPFILRAMVCRGALGRPLCVEVHRSFGIAVRLSFFPFLLRERANRNKNGNIVHCRLRLLTSKLP